MSRARRLSWVVVLLAASCVTESTYQKEVKKAGDLQSQNETSAQLNAALKSEVASNATSAGRAKNRRIEIVLRSATN